MVDLAKFILDKDLTLLPKSMMLSTGKRCILITLTTPLARSNLILDIILCRMSQLKSNTMMSTTENSTERVSVQTMLTFRPNTTKSIIIIRSRCLLPNKMSSYQAMKMLSSSGEDRTSLRRIARPKTLMISIKIPPAHTTMLPTLIMETHTSSNLELTNPSVQSQLL